MTKPTRLLQRMHGSGSQWWQAHYKAVAELEAGEDAIILSVGEVDMPAPQAMMQAAADSLLSGRHRYSEACGERKVRDAIAARYAARCGRSINANQVIFSYGAQACLSLLVPSLLEPGDGLLIPEPRYVTYGGIAAAAGVDAVPVPLDPDKGFHLTADSVEAALTPRSRALVLNSPHNPTGATLARQEVAAIGEVARASGLWILCDEVYEEYVYSDEGFASPFDDSNLADITFAISSLSKSRAVPGWRCGWIVGDADILREATRLFEVVIFSTPPFLQDATAMAIAGDFPECANIRESLADRARTLPERISQVRGIHVPQPEGGIFLFADIRESGLTDLEFTSALYEQEKVSVMPGSAFGESGAGFVRICMAGSDRSMKEACRRIEKFLTEL